MSERRRSRRDKPLPLPAPRPGPALDDKVLAYARANAPQRRPRWIPGWTAGLATAGIAAVALMISLYPQTPPQVPAASHSRADAPAPAAAADAISELRQTRLAEEMSADGAPERAAKAASPPAPATVQAAQATGRPAPATLGDEAAGADAGDAMEYAGAGTATGGLSSAQLRETLAGYRELLLSGAGAQAEEAYRELRESCPGCELPDTLEEALQQYPPQD